MNTTIAKISKILHEKKLLITTAESCTGGLIAKKITDLAGSSAIFERGYVTYSNQAKQDMLGVSSHTLNTYGAVSEQVAKQMASGALENSLSDISLSISGIAGPSGGSKDKPVGTVCFGWMKKGESAISETKVFTGDRETIREKASEHALKGIIKMIDN